jgi:DNA repair photolyase
MREEKAKLMRSPQLSLFPEASVPTLRDIADAVREAGLGGLPDARRRSDEARYQEVHVRSALAEAKGMPFRWTLNPYRGCTHACEYCYARKYQRHLELGTGDDFSSVIFVKRNLPDVLERELTRASWEREQIAIGTATDPYQPIEGHYRITRRCLEVAIRARTPFSIVTKGPMIVRDLDLLVEATRTAGCQIFLSVPSADVEACARLEPGVAPPAQRLRAVRTLVDAGVDAAVLMMPLVPGITATRDGIETTMRAIADAGVRCAGTCVARLDPGVREHFMEFLAREYPSLVDGYRTLYPRASALPSYAAKIKAVTSAIRRSLWSSGRAAERRERPARGSGD